MTTKRSKSKGGAKRRADKYPGYKPEMHPRTRWEYIDMDYIDKLDHDGKAFLSKFADEFYGGSFDKKNSKNIHKTVKKKRECYNRNNAQNRDLLTLSRIRGEVDPMPDNVNVLEKARRDDVWRHEDTIIELLDSQQPKKLRKTETQSDD